jgi:hypothetical protein
MSLLRLLTAGKSLVGLKKDETRYHLPGQGSLPKFGSKKNPFRGTALPGKAEAPRELENEPQDKAPVSENGTEEQAVPEAKAETKKSGGVTSWIQPAGSNGGIKNADGSKSLEPAKRDRSGVRAFLLWGRAKKARSTGNGRPMVQGELSLDAVRVVRNDLSECDVEIVRRSPQRTPAQAVEKKSGAEANGSASDFGWGAAAGRLLGIGKNVT